MTNIQQATTDQIAEAARLLTTTDSINEAARRLAPVSSSRDRDIDVFSKLLNLPEYDTNADAPIYAAVHNYRSALLSGTSVQDAIRIGLAHGQTPNTAALPRLFIRRRGSLSVEEISAMASEFVRRVGILIRTNGDVIRETLHVATVIPFVGDDTMLDEDGRHGPSFCSGAVGDEEALAEDRFGNAVLRYLLKSGAIAEALQHAVDTVAEDVPAPRTEHVPGADIERIVLCSELVPRCDDQRHLGIVEWYEIMGHIAACSDCAGAYDLVSGTVHAAVQLARTKK